ncbi:hypothetical protein Hanom_Chr09g00817871 [Helianthus anomalus]
MTFNDQQPPLITTNSPENPPESPNRPSKSAKLTSQHNEPEPQPDSEPKERETSTTMGQDSRATIQRYLIAIEYFGTRFSSAQQ